MRFYRLTSDNHTAFRINLRRLLLLGAVITDFFAFYSIADIIFSGAIYVLQLIGLSLLSLIVRLYACTLLVSYSYVFDGEKLTVTRSDSLKTRTVLIVSPDAAIEYKPVNADSIKDGGIIDCAGRAKECGIIALRGKRYKIAADEYMTALIQNFLTKEDKT